MSASLYRGDDLAQLLRGALFPPLPGIAYPRLALERPVSRLPIDVWASATLPVGLRLAFESDARSVIVRYQRCASDPVQADAIAMTKSLRADYGAQLELWDPVRRLVARPIDGERGQSEMPLSGDGSFTVYMPELEPIRIDSVEAIGGAIVPRPLRPVWLAYGDSITEGWSASSPALCWPSAAARALDLDLVNLGFSGAGRGEVVVAQALASLPADIVTVAFGTNCWSRIPHSAGLFKEALRAFLDILQAGQKRQRILGISPIVRPDAESTPNALGLTLGSLRAIFEEEFTNRARNDPGLYALRSGHSLISQDDLTDGVHPNDAGHNKIAAAVISEFQTVGFAR